MKSSCHTTPSALLTFDRAEVAIVSSSGDRYPINPLKAPITRELLQIGTIDYRSMKKNVIVPFGSKTLELLLGKSSIEAFDDEKTWFQLENIMDEIAGFATTYQLIRDVRNTICQFWLNQLNDDNCFLLHRKFCEYACDDSANQVYQYIKYNLVRMVIDKTIDVTFYRLAFEDFGKLLSEDDLNVEEEKDVISVIDKWIASSPGYRQTFRHHLMSNVRAAGLDEKSRLDHQHLNLSSKPPRKSRDILLLVGGWQQNKSSDRLEWYDLEAKCWRVSTIKTPSPLAYHGAAIIDDQLYIFGGSDGFKFKCETWKIGAATSWQWKRCDNMMDARNYITNSSVVYEGKIYVFGGQDGREIERRSIRCKSGEVYDPVTNRWTRTAFMHDMRSDCAAVVYQNQIYVCGGFDGTILNTTIEVYNPQGDFFVRISPLPQRISGHSLVVLDDQMLLVGGFNGVDRLNRILVWNREGEWREHEETLELGRSTSTCCVYRGNLVMLGGYNSVVLDTVECKLGTKEILEIPNMLSPKSACKVLVAKNWRGYLETPVCKEPSECMDLS